MFRKRLLLLVMLAFFVAGAKGFGQTITVSVKNAFIEKVFMQIEKQAGVRFFYKQELLKLANKVTFKIKKGTLKEALDLCFKGQPFLYEIIGSTVVVKQKGAARFSSQTETVDPVPGSYTIKGQILTSSGRPAEGATLKVKGAGRAAICDADGKFSIVVENKKAILEITSSVTEPKEIMVDRSTDLKIIVNEKISELDQVQIIGYGQTTRRFNTGNVTTIRSDEIEKQPVNNILAALEGRVPGLVVTQKTGLTGGAFDVELRGRGTISAGSDPLIIVDGVPFPLDLYRTSMVYKFNNVAAKAGGNPLNLLNVGDIEQVDVLKDADATAIYGSRGANGVLLITTKKAKLGKASFSLKAYTGMGRVNRLPKMLNLQQYLEMRREAKKNNNAFITAFDVDINGTWDTTRYTNWTKELLGGAAATTDVQLSLSGGSKQMSYLLNSTYHRETSVMPTKGADRNYALYFSASNASKNKKLQTALSVGYLSKIDDLPPVDLAVNLNNCIPNQPASFLPDGSLNYALQIFNPYMKLKELYKMKAMNLVSRIKISYRPVRGLELSVSAGMNKQYQHDFYGVPTVAQLPGNKSYARYSANRLTTLIIEPQALYSFPFKHQTKFSALIGSTYQNSLITYRVRSASDFSNDAFISQPEYAATTKLEGSSYKNYKYLGSFSRLSFNQANKYLVNLTGRIDGTSRFGSEKQFHPFGAVGLAWIYSEEDFMKKVPWITSAKLRGSYGFIGNSEILDYSFSPVYVPVLSAYQGITGTDPNVPYNKELGWELKKALEVAMELQLFKGRLGLSVSLYRTRNSAQLVYRFLSAVTGFLRVLENSPTVVENKGLEIALQYTPFNTPNFSWNLMVNATLPKNSLRRFDGIGNTPYSDVLSVGQPLTSLKLYRFGGVDPANGNYFFLDKNGTPTTTVTKDDKTGVVDRDPKSYGSITSNVNYKGLSFDVHCMFIVRRGKAAFAKSGLPPGFMENQPVEVLSRWQQPGDRTSVAKYTQDLLAYFSQNYPGDYDQQYTNASFVRIKNISVSYSFKKECLKRMHLENLRFYLQGQNILTFTPYKNLDPETANLETYNNGIRMPLLRTLTAGFQITF